jgi:monovalent cation:H+ antiporter-2, CPA2 family
MLVIATSDTIDVRKMVETAKLLQPSIKIVVRTDNESEFNFLNEENIGRIFYAQEELASGMCQFILEHYHR